MKVEAARVMARRLEQLAVEIEGKTLAAERSGVEVELSDTLAEVRQVVDQATT